MNKKYLDDLGLAEVASIVNQKLKQVSEMPLASEELAGKIYQYIGDTTLTYTNGYFYGCEKVGGSYQWVQKNVQEDVPHVSGTYNEIQQKIANNEIPDGAYTGITDDYDENVQVGIYSTEETKTGEIWIDGKPIYRRVLTGTMPDVRGSAPAYITDKVLFKYGDFSVDTVVRAIGGIYYGKTSASTPPLNQLGFLPLGRIHVTNSGTGGAANCNDETFWYTGSNGTPANRPFVLYASGSQVAGLYAYNPPYIVIVEYTKTTD